MKKALLVLLILILVVVAVLLLQDSSSDTGAPNTSNTTTSTTEETGEENRAAEAEALLGISLPDDAFVSLVLDNSQTAGAVGQTNLSLEETQSFFAAEMSQVGYSPARGWGVSPVDSTTSRSATFRGSGENWSINLRSEAGATSFDIQRQY